LLWIAALAIEYAGPYALFRTPGYGRSLPSDWDISGAHMAERCALFMIIALGEAVLITGATFAQLERDTPTWVAFISSFIGSATMWWIYFDIGAKRGSKVIAESENVGLIARTAYTYLHIPIVAGVVVTAVADEKILAHPVGHSDLPLILVAIGGPVLFLFGNQMFKWVTSGARIPPFSHFLGLFALAAVGVGGWLGHWEPLTLGVSANAVLVFTAVWEWFSLHGGWQRWAPWMAPLFNRFGRAS
jgi:low temperature requirement protein LtrA